MKNSIKWIWYIICKNLLVFINDAFFCKMMLLISHLRLGFRPYFPNFTKPKTFNEHINYFKLNYKDNLGSLVADKVKVRDYVKEKIGEDYLISIHGIYENADEINFEALPENGFAIKTNHGSGWNIICKNKKELNVQKAIDKLNYWLKLNIYYINREIQYKSIKPLLICEQLLTYEIFDFKVFCFFGEPKFIQIDINRFTEHQRLFFDTNWRELDFSINYPISKKKVEKPKLLDEMIDVSKTLSSDFDFVRIDLYIYEEKLYFGEMTLFPGGGFEPFLNYEQDLLVGSYFNKPSL